MPLEKYQQICEFKEEITYVYNSLNNSHPKISEVVGEQGWSLWGVIQKSASGSALPTSLPRPSFENYFLTVFDESTTLAPNNPSCCFSKSSSGANILISYNLPNICVNSLAYEANFSAIFFSWHSTIEISNNHIFYYSFICP